jgi:carbamoyltransferase
MWNAVTRYHPQIGFTFMPSLKTRLPWETGGYNIRTNAAGFRSDVEFVKERTPGKFRALVFGDSQTAGDGVPNQQRYSELLAARIPNLEMYNYGLPGSSTDQHYLTYQHCADVEHDLVVIGMHVENIGQVSNRFRPYTDADGKEIIYTKPYYTLEADELTLHHVPVPKGRLTRETFSPEDARYIDWGVPYPALRNVVKKLGMRDLMQKITRFQPVPAYDAPDNPKWLLLRKILKTWIEGSRAPVLLLVIPMWPFIEESSDPANYQARFRELVAETGCYTHDPLADLQKFTAAERRAFRFPIDPHFTAPAHGALADSIAPVLERIIAERGIKS